MKLLTQPEGEDFVAEQPLCNPERSGQVLELVELLQGARELVPKAAFDGARLQGGILTVELP